MTRIRIPKQAFLNVAEELGATYTKRIPRRQKKQLKQFIIRSAIDRAIEVLQQDRNRNAA